MVCPSPNRPPCLYIDPGCPAVEYWPTQRLSLSKIHTYNLHRMAEIWPNKKSSAHHQKVMFDHHQSRWRKEKVPISVHNIAPIQRLACTSYSVRVRFYHNISSITPLQKSKMMQGYIPCYNIFFSLLQLNFKIGYILSLKMDTNYTLNFITLS